MMDDEFIETVVAACRQLPNAEAVNLGGSRARGDFRPGSDWDFAVYYRGDVDPRPLEDLGWPGRVFRPFEWGQVMYGGAVFDLDGRHFDIHFRNLDVVEHWTREANEGRFEVHILGFHLAGIPTYMLTGELAGSQTLWGDLPRPDYPDALRMSAPPFWLGRAKRELDYASYYVNLGQPDWLCRGAGKGSSAGGTRPAGLSRYLGLERKTNGVMGGSDQPLRWVRSPWIYRSRFDRRDPRGSLVRC